mmetsp:Transcript_80581/g.193274  ORF Transcript_80581/g.193274 Transcript_80581/m.193274 type:complete len:273 (+) Transcript_80581:473-1291(+)
MLFHCCGLLFGSWLFLGELWLSGSACAFSLACLHNLLSDLKQCRRPQPPWRRRAAGCRGSRGGPERLDALPRGRGQLFQVGSLGFLGLELAELLHMLLGIVDLPSLGRVLRFLRRSCALFAFGLLGLLLDLGFREGCRHLGLHGDGQLGDVFLLLLLGLQLRQLIHVLLHGCCELLWLLHLLSLGLLCRSTLLGASRRCRGFGRFVGLGQSGFGFRRLAPLLLLGLLARSWGFLLHLCCRQGIGTHRLRFGDLHPHGQRDVAQILFSLCLRL